MAMKITRRELAMTALAARVAAGAAQQQPEGETVALQDKALDPVAWTLMRYEQMPLRMTFKATTRKQAETWQKQLRAKLTELLGGFPAERAPLEPQRIETREFDEYRRERVLFTSRPGLKVAAYLLTPKEAKGPLPVMICVPGHGAGVDEIIGIAGGKDNYQHQFAVQMVNQGVAALAIEPVAFGCRRDAKTKKKGAGTSACQPTAGAALLFGETMIGWRVYDVMRSIDWIATRPELDAKRVGCMGISGGGTCTQFSAALEPRIKVAMVSGYLNTFRDSILSLSHCIDNYVPGILQWAESYDVAGLIAPRPLFVESGTEDDIFPIAASKDSFARVKKVYDLFGASANADQEVFEGEHSFWGKRGVPFVAEHLRKA